MPGPTTRSAKRCAVSSSTHVADTKRARRDGFRVPYKLGESVIAGRGIFTTKPIKRGTLIWQYKVGESVLEHDEASMRARLRAARDAFVWRPPAADPVAQPSAADFVLGEACESARKFRAHEDKTGATSARPPAPDPRRCML